MKYEKYLTERKRKDDGTIRKAIADMDPKYYTRLRNSYYGVGDHIDNLERELKKLYMEHGKDSYFGEEYANATRALKFFDDMTLGKYL
jgi:hypothetical protein